jgi:hypothetical protein
MPQFSLGKAHKILQELSLPEKRRQLRRRRMYHSEESEQLAVQAGVVRLALPPRGVSDEAVAEEVRVRIDSSRKAVDDHLSLAEDRARIKEALFAANVHSGVSARLARQALLAGEVAILESGISALAQAPVGTVGRGEITSDLVRELRAAPASDREQAVSISVRLHDVADLQLRLRAAREELHQLDEEIRVLNAQTMIEVELRPATLRLLGLG